MLIGSYLTLLVLWLCTKCVHNQDFNKKSDSVNNYLGQIKTIDVEIQNGKIRGRVGKTESKKEMFYGFRGLRYAEVPERFEPARRVKPWTGIYDATRDRFSCVQSFEAESGLPESEDCLFINVYTPRLPGSDKKFALLPVMFWVHGGAQMSGDSAYRSYGPDYFLEENVIIVTLNYRVGVFGFLSTGDSLYPGNNGLKDLALGLQWVQDNIKYFGGDRNSITLFGQSAGGAMAMYLAQSPLTRGKGYFHKVIAQSGNTLCPWSVQRSPRDVANRMALATLCGIYVFDSRRLVDCLKTVDVNILKLAQLGVFLGDSGFFIGILNGLAFAPNVEPESSTAAVTQKSYELLTEGNFPKVPCMFGVTSEELLIVANNLTLLRPLLLQVDAAPAILIPQDMYASFYDSLVNVAGKIRNYYFDGGPITLNSKAKIIRYLSDHFFDRPTREIVNVMANKTDVYYYRFSYFGAMGLSTTQVEGLEKVQHGAELSYMWRTNTANFNNTNVDKYPKIDKLVRQRLIKMWTNFARAGNPTPFKDELLENVQWPKANNDNSSDINCLDIGQHMNVIINPDDEQYKLWKSLYTTYGKPVDTF